MILTSDRNFGTLLKKIVRRNYNKIDPSIIYSLSSVLKEVTGQVEFQEYYVSEESYDFLQGT